MATPSFRETHISQIPALQLLMKLGYRYLTPSEALEARGRRSSNVLLESILKKQLALINKIEHKGKEFPFSAANINAGVLAMRDLPVEEGFMSSNQAFYDLITLGRNFEQSVLGDKKSFPFRYIDWDNIENNVFHVTEEYNVLRTGRSDSFIPDIVLFVNGIPMVVIECKSPAVKHPVDKGIEQHLRNCKVDGIRSLYQYSNILISLAVNDGRYATTGSGKEFWGVWREQHESTSEEERYKERLKKIKNSPLPENERSILFKERFREVLPHFEKLEEGEQVVTAQDSLLYNICRKERLMDLIRFYILYDNGEKKIARYQQYFAVKRTMERILRINPDGSRQGGVIWHTQGSGKSLTMVILAQQIVMHPAIHRPKILLVTDRVDLDDQITETFKKCQRPVKQANTGIHLVELLNENDDAIITTIINKFDNAIKTGNVFESNNVFVLVDEGHRSQYGLFNIKMKRLFPKACFVAFTGTPLMKKEKSTAGKFGGLIDIYSINNAVEDKAVVPLLYEGRHNIMDVNAKPLDNYFDMVAEDVTEYGKVTLKRKFSAKNKLIQSLQFIENTAWDISRHFVDNFQGTGFKGQLVAPTKLSAIRYKDALKAIGKVSVEVLISPPDSREGEDDVYEEVSDKVKSFYSAMMDKYSTQEKYEKAIINSFKKQDKPEIIIVVSKLLTGFDAPLNRVLYITKNLMEHSLLQAVARVNRLAPGKDYGLILDYYGNLENLDGALKMYSGDDTYDDDDFDGTITDVSKEISRLPQAHSELKEIFKEIPNKYDEAAYEELLSDDAKRYRFYEKLSIYARLLKLALSNWDFNRDTSEGKIHTYRNDAKFFLSLRTVVMRRYFDDIDYKEYEAEVQKLIDRHITATGEVLKITSQVNIFNKEEREAEVEKLTGKAAKADHIASRTRKAISIKMSEDPVFYKRLSELIKQTIDDYHQKRISEAEYLQRVMQQETDFFAGSSKDVPPLLRGNKNAIAYYNLVSEELRTALDETNDKIGIASEIALAIDEIVNMNILDNGNQVIDWFKNVDIKGKMRIEIDDLLFDMKSKHNLNATLEHFDQLIAESIKIAESKYKS